MKIDKNNLTYSNEHPRGKKLSEDIIKNGLSKSQEKKLLAYKSNGAVGKRFMKMFNQYKELFTSLEGAFEFTEKQLRKEFGPGNQ